MYAGAPRQGLDNWKNLGPISISEIIEKSCEVTKLLPDVPIEELEFKRVEKETYYKIGFFRRGTDVTHGIVRSVGKSGQIQEGMQRESHLNGFSRVFYEDGDIYIGMQRNHKREGYGTLIKANGDIKEGMWKNNYFQQNE